MAGESDPRVFISTYGNHFDIPRTRKRPCCACAAVVHFRQERSLPEPNEIVRAPIDKSLHSIAKERKGT